METIQHLLQYILHIDEYLINFVSLYGVWTYVVIFLIIFCETGLVIFPFLPGDSLLFAAGSICANSTVSTQSILSIQLLFVLLIIAASLGNKVNYLIGRAIGPKVFTTKHIWLNQKNLMKAHEFYERHGGKTIILSRFLPIIRTFAPFVAGVSYMSIRRFSVYNIISAFLWIGSLLWAGYYFGSMPFIRDNFSIVVYGIISLSLLPPIFLFFVRKSSSL